MRRNAKKRVLFRVPNMIYKPCYTAHDLVTYNMVDLACRAGLGLLCKGNASLDDGETMGASPAGLNEAFSLTRSLNGQSFGFKRFGVKALHFGL